MSFVRTHLEHSHGEPGEACGGRRREDEAGAAELSFVLGLTWSAAMASLGEFVAAGAERMR